MPPFDPLPDHRFAASASVTALTLALLGGCASPSAPKVDEVKVRQFAGKGYQTDRQFSFTTSFLSWEVEGRPVDLTLAMPSGVGGRVPLIVYLPGLGEGRNAGMAWRTAWAASGYAVLCLQALPEDARAWSSPQARAGDFALLARERYSSRAMGSRLATVAAILNEVVRRQANADAVFGQVDTERVAIAGFDIGAYAAMALAGERIRDVNAPLLPARVRAVVALSPFADFSGAAFADRYTGIRLPVLSVTGSQDTDALGVVTSAAVRRAPFEYMPAGGKVLLNLNGVTHATLSGRGAATQIEEEPALFEMSARRRSKNEAEMMDPAERQMGPTLQAIGETAIRSVTTAFFDAHLKDDSIAGDWLGRDAGRWLAGRGELRRK